MPSRALFDPLAALVEATVETAQRALASLTRVDVDVKIRGGLVMVEVTRTYRNQGPEPIEAVLSFPVPVSAICYGLTAIVDGKRLKGQILGHDESRDAYEQAIGRGQFAVLHEELLRGIHMLSVGNLAAGAESTVTIRWADLVQASKARARYRIPMTVGQVYGQSGLPETDELRLGGMPIAGGLRLRHDARAAMLRATPLMPEEGSDILVAEIASNQSLEFELDGWEPRNLVGVSNDGRQVSIKCNLIDADEGPLDVAQLVDISESMADRLTGRGSRGRTKMDAARTALRHLRASTRAGDRTSLWEFHSSCNRLWPPYWPEEYQNPYVGGRYRYAPHRKRRADRRVPLETIAGIRCSEGEASINRALRSSDSEGNRDVLLITDGLSFGLDVLDHASKDRRVFVILVGADSLEAQLGHLAALTGGGVYYSFGGSTREAVNAVLPALRTRWQQARIKLGSNGLPLELRAIRGSLDIEANWTSGGNLPAPKSSEPEVGRAVGALAAWLAFSAICESKVRGSDSPPVAPERGQPLGAPHSDAVPDRQRPSESVADTAKKLALHEGILTHDSSLVLIDQEVTVPGGLPKFEKLLLPTPLLRVAKQIAGSTKSRSDDPGHAKHAPCHRLEEWRRVEVPRSQLVGWMATTGSKLNWAYHRKRLAECRIDTVPMHFSMVVRLLSRHPHVARFAETEVTGLDGLRVAIALVAFVSARRSRAAGKVGLSLIDPADDARFLQFVTEFVGQSREEFEERLRQ